MAQVEKRAMWELLSMPGNQNGARSAVRTDPKGMRRAPTLLLLSDDEALAGVVRGIVMRPWVLAHHSTQSYLRREGPQQNVRLVILDDQAVEETDRGWMLAQIRKRFSGTPLLYVAANQSDANERRARTNGAHYYISKPVSVDQFGHVLKSFLQAQRTDRNSRPAAAPTPE
jgi:DNA-binding NtrC family response regulator